MKKENTGETDEAEEQEENEDWDTMLAKEPESKKPAEDDFRQVRVMTYGELSLGDKLNKLYHELRKGVQSDGNNLRHTIQSVGTAIDLGAGHYKTAAVLLKSVYSQIKAETVKAKAAEMYSLITGSQIEKLI